MLKKIVNNLKIDLTINNIDPILVRSGYASISGPHANPIKTWREGRPEPEPFLPGSSLKGVFRSHLEKIIRTIDTQNKTLVCLPYEVAQGQKKSAESTGAEIFCGNKFQYLEKQRNITISNETAYSDACPICRVFGSTYFKGKIAISDAYIPEGEDFLLEERDGVALDRFTGGAASGALFQEEVVSKAIFKTSIALKNFEIWQLGMIGILIKDMQDELLQVGSGTSRGHGRIKATVNTMNISFLRSLENNNEIWGIGRFLNDDSYGTNKNDKISLKTATEFEQNGIWKTLKVDQELRESIFEDTIKCFISIISNWNTPQKMRFENHSW